MDKRTDAKEEVKKLERQLYGESPVLDFAKARQLMQASTKETLEELDGVINSRWTWGNQKAYLKMFQAIIKLNAQSSESIVNLFELLNDYRQAILLIAVDLENLKEKLKDVDAIKANTAKILQSPAVRQITQILQDSEDALKKLDKTRQDILRDSVV